MPRIAVEDNNRLSLRIASVDKAIILKAAALAHMDMTSFIARNAVEAAHKLIDKSERIALSKCDSLMLLDLLENPPRPNAKALKAVKALPKRK